MTVYGLRSELEWFIEDADEEAGLNRMEDDDIGD